jgi:hypothetical protein
MWLNYPIVHVRTGVTSLNYQELQVIIVLVASWPYMLYVAFMMTRQELTIQIGALIVGIPRCSQRSSPGIPPKL